MIADLLMIPEEVYQFSGKNEPWEITDIDLLDYLYEVQSMELRPRIYRGDYGERLWCVEIYDWSKKFDNHIKTLVGYKTRKDAVHYALLWYFENSVKES